MNKIFSMTAILITTVALSGCSSMMSAELDSGYGAPAYQGVQLSQNISTDHVQDPRDLVALSADTNVSAMTHNTFADPQCQLHVGDIIIYTRERKLMFATGCGEGDLYPIAVGREGMQWSGSTTVERKAEWPDWRPPEEMRIREAAKGHDLPEMMPGGPDNPLGARAIYLAGTPYRIHGTNKPESIGTDASSGCIRMHNADVIALYNKVPVGAHVYVLDQNGNLSNSVMVQN